MFGLRLACVALAFLALSQAQCVGRIQYPVCTPCAPVAPVSIPVTISVEKCATPAGPGRATVCTDDLSTLLLLNSLSNNQQPQQSQCNTINADQLINKLVNALVYTCGCANGGGGSSNNNGGGSGYNNGGGSGYNNGGGSGGNKDPLIELGLLRPGKNNVAELALGTVDTLGVGVGAGNSKGGLSGTLNDLLG